MEESDDLIYLTSDCHFNHTNLLNLEPITRPFNSVDEMNETIIYNWNSVVNDDDDIYVCGDFFMGRVEDIGPILHRLKGKIHLIRGNHDDKRRRAVFEKNGIDISDIKYINYKGKFFILNHFPVSEDFINMVRKDNAEVVVCYGHIHSNAPTGYIKGTYHVGVDTNNLTPVSIEDIWIQSNNPCANCTRDCGFDNRCGEFAKM